MLTRLPAAYFAGLRIEAFTEEQCIISVRQKWFNKNPFKSIYFAILQMAAEVSTGIAGFSAVYKRNPAVSMLVIASEAKFYKKATGKILFTCNSIAAVHETVEKVISTGEAQTIVCRSTGTNADGVLIGDFYFTWSFKAKTASN